jgi:transcriptional regulator with XRE-family HTH domain
MTKANNIDKEIGAKIELNRKLKSKSRKWLSDKINRSSQQVQKYESGQDRVAASCLFEISKELETDINNFFPNQNEK